MADKKVSFYQKLCDRATKIKTFIKNLWAARRLVALWTLIYAVAIWAIFFVLFGFNFAGAAAWHTLNHIALHGFSGFVFGTLFVCVIPLYIAMVYFIAQNKKLPNPFVIDKPKEEKKDEAQPTDVAPAAPQIKIPDTMPREMQEPYLRAIRTKKIQSALQNATTPRDEIANTEPKNQVAENTPPEQTDTNHASPNPSAEPIIPNTFAPEQDFTDTPAPSDFPIPTDFGFDDTPTERVAPVFKEISFGNDDNDDVDAESSKDMATDDTTAHGADHTNTLAALTDMGYKTESDGDIIIATKNKKRFAIAIHDSPDFWTADGDTWFANGDEKPSPVFAVLADASAHNATPVLILASDNIMDITDRRAEWEKSGIRIINNIGEL